MPAYASDGSLHPPITLWFLPGHPKVRRRMAVGTTILAMFALLFATIMPATANSAPAASPPESLSDGLVAYYNFDDGTATDSSGNNNHGMLFGTTPDSGVVGGALAFNGTDDYIQVPPAPSLNLTTELTISAWVKALSSDLGFVVILTKGNGEFTNTPYAIVYYDAGADNLIPHVRFLSAEGAYQLYNANISNTLPFGNWSFVTWRYNHGRLSIFRDGVLLGDQELGFTTLAVNDLPLEIGHNIPGSTEFFHGSLDELRIYNRALSDSEIQTLAAIPPPEPEADLNLAGISWRTWDLTAVDQPSLKIDSTNQRHISYYNKSGGLSYWRTGSNGNTWATVDNQGDVGMDSALALNNADLPRISYYDATNRDLKYAAFDGVNWQITTVDSAGSVGRHGSLALDSAGNPHISYHDATRGTLKYARFDGTGWQISTIDGAGKVGIDSSLALDAADHPHISYYDQTNRDLKYALFDGSTWQITTVDSTGFVGTRTSLALDSQGHPHISYHDWYNRDLKYARSDGAGWQISVVDSEGQVGLDTSLVLDRRDRPRISYLDWTKGELKFAVFDGVNWQFTVVDSTGHVGWESALALDRDGLPYFVYRDSNYRLKYAEPVVATTTTDWRYRTIDSDGNVGSYSSLAIDSYDHPHISYIDRTNGDLKYAVFRGRVWQTEVVHQTPSSDVFEPSLAIDGKDRPHICYTYGVNGDLKHAWFDGAAWQIKTIARDGRDCLLAIDASGHLHVSYHHQGHGFVYASSDGATWQFTTLVLGMVHFHSLVLDSQGRPHIAYSHNYALNHSFFDGNVWQNRTLISGRWEIYSPSLALDSQDRPHIAYTSQSSGMLAYTFFDGSSWQTTILARGVELRGPKLVLDSQDRPHISYTEYDSKDLAYAHFDGSGWQYEIVDNAEWVQSGDMALDSRDRPHISYYYSQYRDLKYVMGEGIR